MSATTLSERYMICIFIGLSFIFVTNGQCDRYLDITDFSFSTCRVHSTGSFGTDHSQIFNVALNKCLPNYKDYEPKTYTYFKDLDHNDDAYCTEFTSTSTSRYRESSPCGYNFNMTKQEECENNDCVQNDEFQTKHIGNTCQYDLSFDDVLNWTTASYATFVGYGYYINKCNQTQNPLYFRWKAECDNIYQLTFYTYNNDNVNNKNCLFQASIFANQTYADMDGINCTALSECVASFDGMDQLLFEDHNCTNECFTKSILTPVTTEPTTTHVNESSGYSLFVEKVWFIIIFGISLFMLIVSI